VSYFLLLGGQMTYRCYQCDELENSCTCVEIPVDEEIYWAARRSILEDVVKDVELLESFTAEGVNQGDLVIDKKSVISLLRKRR